MRILQLHCDSIEYTPTKKEIKSAEEIEPKKIRIEEVIVCFIAVEEGDDSNVAKNASIEIQESMKKIGCNKLLLYPYAHLSSTLASPGTGLKIYDDIVVGSQEEYDQLKQAAADELEETVTVE